VASRKGDVSVNVTVTVADDILLVTLQTKVMRKKTDMHSTGDMCMRVISVQTKDVLMIVSH